MTTYKQAGVDIAKGNEFVRRINKAVPVGGFAGMFPVPEGYENPIMVAATDGVGTKVKLAKTEDELRNIGQDLVAMVVNDIICCGADPLFFLDYFATGELDLYQGLLIIEGINKALRRCDMQLLGGETAEMPDVYAKGEFDLAGFGVGIVQQDDIIDGSEVRPGDVIVGIESSGPHANGYSLIRKVLENLPMVDNFNDTIPMDQIMEPTVLYPPIIKGLQKDVPIKAIAHITGGGLQENVARVVDSDYQCIIEVDSWKVPKVFKWLHDAGNLSWDEMYRVFNMGIGMVVVVDPVMVRQTIHKISTLGHKSFKIGWINTKNETEFTQQSVVLV